MNLHLFKRGQPPEELLRLLRGGPAPMDFVDNGCSCSFDWKFTEACRRHDYRYYRCARDFWYRGKKVWKAQRKLADQDLRFNIMILSMRVVDGRAVKPRFWLLSGYFQWTRYLAVRWFGRRSAKPDRKRR